jgi:hypothetical protein
MSNRTKLESVGLYQARLIFKSGNPKVGAIPVSYSSARTCPDACQLKGNGCYAENHHVARAWADAARFEDWVTFCLRVKMLPSQTLWRHNVAGDLPGEGDRLDTRALRLLVESNIGKRGFTYTHKPLRKATVKALQQANAAGFTVNVSADSLDDADKATRAGLPTVVTLTSDAPQVSYTPAGRTVIACPAETNDVTCETCQLCANATRKAIVGFRAHGQSKERVNRRLRVLQ